LQDNLPRRLAAILYADVAGYSRLTEVDEEGTPRRLSGYLDVIASSIEEHRGRVVHYAGDAVLADFDTATAALTCAPTIQQRLASRNQALPEARRVQFRRGVNVGEVIVDRDDLYAPEGARAWSNRRAGRSPTGRRAGRSVSG
jgi:class 3 adenylate cyclase